MKNAFTMLELVFVIAVLGIVASIGSEIIARVYEQYIVQRAQYKSSSKTELAAYQIANRLTYAIPGTVYRIKNDDALEPITTALTVSSDAYKGIQWVGSDRDGFEATSTAGEPGWSGFCDLSASTKDAIITPGSKLSLTNAIIGNLEGNINGSRIFFAKETNASIPHTITAFTGDTQINLASVVGTRRMAEHYKLAWTSYAVVVDANNDLMLYYKFSPTVDANYTTGSSALLLHDVTIFKFTGTEGSIRFKVCRDENITSSAKVTACKEKVVF